MTRPPGSLLTARAEKRWKDDCDSCSTTTVWTTHYVDEQGKSTTCLTTDYATATITTTNTPTPTITAAANVYTIMHTTTSTVVAAGATAVNSAGTSSAVSTQSVRVEGAHCDCEHAWLRFIFGGVPNGAGDVVACIAFFVPFLLYFLLCTARLFSYLANREVFFVLIPFTIFLAVMAAALPTRAYAATHHDTEHIVAFDVMIALAVPLLMDVAFQVYGLLRKRAEMSGWLDSSSLLLRTMNVLAMILYVVGAAKMGTFIGEWQDGTANCASASPSHVGTLLIVAGFVEIFALLLGLIGVALARWRLRMSYTPLLIQAHVFLLLFVFFIVRLAHDIGAANAWSRRTDQTCNPLAQASLDLSDDDSVYYFFDFDWSGVGVMGHVGLNSQAAFWMIGMLPVFIAATVLMMVNLLVYSEALPELLPEPDSVRYKLCYNENEKKMEFVRLDNPGGPTLPDGEPLYEVVRDDDGDNWQIREARVSTVLPPWQNVTMRPWYK